MNKRNLQFDTYPSGDYGDHADGAWDGAWSTGDYGDNGGGDDAYDTGEDGDDGGAYGTEPA